MSIELEQQIKRLRGLTQYRNKTEDELTEIAKEKVFEHSIDLSGAYIDVKEKKLAKELLRRYLDDFDIDTVSDKNTLQQLIELEIIHNRLQKILNKAHKNNQATPLNMVDTIHKNINEITLLKDKLGISKDKRSKDQVDSFKSIEILKEKFKRWRSENQASRTLACPHCSRIFLLKIRTDIWEAQKHPFFKDKVLYNKHLMELYHTKKITRHDVALILESSDDYIDWMIDKIEMKNMKEEKDEA